MGPSRERALIRKTLVLAAIFIASCMVVLFLVGDRFSRRVVVTDGGEVYQAPVWQSAMRSTWKEEGAITNPRTLKAGISERAGTFDPMTSSLCFARRDSEGTWNLYRASWSSEGWLEPEPLFELNSSADDTDPVFIEGGRALLFASRREGGRGGFDIWRAEREGDTFADPICLPASVNSPADDRHPTYLVNGGGLIFASNRLAEDRTRFELFECEKVNGSWQEPRLMRALNGEVESETRSPTVSADGRFLFFTSDREGGAGGFDLWRSFRYRDRWQAPEPLTALNTEADEVDPSLSAEGARLVFARSRLAEDGFETGLWLAERRELLRLETPGSRWWQTLLYVLAAILIALLLAWLYLYWKRLHPFIKFLILSIILHILFLLMADPEEGYELPEGQGGAQAFRVTFLPSNADDASDGAAAGDAVTAEKAATEASMPASAAAAAAVNDAPSVESPSAASALEDMTRQPAASTAEVSSDLAAAASPSRQAETARASVSAPRAAADTRQRQGVDTPVASAQGTAAGTAAAPGRSTIEGEANEAAQPSSANVTTLAPEPGASNLSGRSPRPAVAEGLPSSAAPSPRPLADRGIAVPAQKTGTSPRRRGRAEDESSAIADAAAAAGSTNAAKQSPDLPAGRSASNAESPATAQGAGDLSPTGNLQARGREDLTAERPVTAGGSDLSRRGRAPSAAGKLRARESETTARGGKGEAEDAAVPTAGGDAREFEEDAARRAAVVGKRSAMAGERPAATDSEDASGAASALEARRARFDESSPAARPESPAFARGRRRAPRPGLLRGRTQKDSRPDRGEGEAARLAGPSRPSSWEQVPQRRGQGPLASAKSHDRGRSQRRQDALVAPRDLLRRRQVDLQEESPAAVASVYGNRSGLARLEALKSGGGSEETEAAVLAGLRYLAKVQRRTGAWGRATDDDKYGDVRVGKSSLALLAFLGSGYTHKKDGEFRKTVGAGLEFILGQQNKRSGHIGEGSAYSHGIATYALAEAYAMTEDRSLRQPLFLAVQRIRTAQLARGDRRTDGGWSYYYEDQERRYDAWPRMSVTVWQIMALESARISGIKIPDRVFDRARRYVVRSWDRRLDSFRYNHDPEWLRSRYPTLPGSSAAAIFALQLLGEDGAEAEVRAGVQSLMQKLPTRRWRRASSDDFVRRGAGNEYYLYYATLALRMRGGANWKRWNDRLKPLLLESQQANGSWRPISHYAEYARDTDRDRSYTTAMNVLMLEIYYRYDTPLLRKLAQQVQKKRPETAGPRVVVDEVEAQTVAYRAGLRNEDVILSIADTPVATFEELRRVNRSITPSMRLRVKVRRGSRQIELEFSGPLEGFTIREEE